MSEIIPVNYHEDILPEYRETPVGLLLEYHNLGRATGAASTSFTVTRSPIILSAK